MGFQVASPVFLMDGDAFLMDGDAFLVEFIEDIQPIVQRKTDAVIVKVTDFGAKMRAHIKQEGKCTHATYAFRTRTFRINDDENPYK